MCHLFTILVYAISTNFTISKYKKKATLGIIVLLHPDTKQCNRPCPVQDIARPYRYDEPLRLYIFFDFLLHARKNADKYADQRGIFRRAEEEKQKE